LGQRTGYGNFGDDSAGGGGTEPVAGETPTGKPAPPEGTAREVAMSGFVEQGEVVGSPGGQPITKGSQKPVVGLHTVLPVQVA